MTNLVISITTPLIAGILLLIGYIVQKKLEYINNVKSEKLEIYSKFLQYYWIDANDEGEQHWQETVHWRTMMMIYSSDKVLECLSFLIQAENDSKIEDLKPYIDDLYSAMRKDILGKTTSFKPIHIKNCSPFESNID